MTFVSQLAAHLLTVLMVLVVTFSRRTILATPARFSVLFSDSFEECLNTSSGLGV